MNDVNQSPVDARMTPLQVSVSVDLRAAVGDVPAARSLLFAPLRMNQVTLANRVWLPAMVTWLSNEEGIVTPDVEQRYLTYARGEPGMIVLEAMGIRDVASGPLLRIGHDRYIPGLRDLVAKMHAISPSKVIPQVIDFLKIARRNPQSYRAHLQKRGGAFARAPELSDAELQGLLTPREWRDYQFGYRQLIGDLSREEVLSLPGLFAAAARRAREAGFDGVELHFAHAYTMSSFLSGCNGRSDEFGGASLENRVRLPLMAIEAVRRMVGRDFLVGLRYLSSEDIAGGSTVEDACWFGAQFAKAGVDFISISRGGKFEDAEQPRIGEAAYPYTGHSGLMCMPREDRDATANRQNAARIRRAIREAGLATPTVVAGRINTFEMAESILRAGGADLIGMARGLLADPYWPVKVRDGRDFHHCKYTNVCEALDRHHRQVRCQLWMKTVNEDGSFAHHIHPPAGW